MRMRDAMYLKLSGISWNDLKDRPFGDFVELVEIVPEQDVTADRTMNSGTMYVQQIGIDLPINDGVKGKIVVNGKEYSVSCVEYNEDGEHGKDFCNEDDTSAWATAVEENGEFIWELMWSVDLGETITLAIYEEQSVTKPLNEKFVPDLKPLWLDYIVIDGHTDNVLQMWDDALHEYRVISADEFNTLTQKYTGFPNICMYIDTFDGNNGTSYTARPISIGTLTDAGKVYIPIYTIIDGEIATFYIGENPNDGPS